MDAQKRTRALIADDEPELAHNLCDSLLRLWPELDVVAVVHDGQAAAEILEKQSVDVAFLDIRMPGLSGLQVAAQMRGPRIVFVTAYNQHAIEAFKVAAVDYIMKPVSDERLAETISRLKTQRAGGPGLSELTSLLHRLLPQSVERLRFVQASIGTETHLIDVASVLYFRSSDKYTSVQTVQREYLIRTPLKELLLQLEPEQFWQIHRNTIVNIQCVASARREPEGAVTLRLRGRPETLAVSRAFAHRFHQM